MSRLISFNKCIARPNQDEHVSLLTSHLERVRDLTCSFFLQEDDEIVQFLMEVAAVSHDIGKAHVDWQEYIREKRRRGPNHSACGAMFFSYIAYEYLQATNKWQDYQRVWAFITRDIADHHGTLKGIAKNEDIDTGHFNKMDMQGIGKWLYDEFPLLQGYHIEIDKDILMEWQYDEFSDICEEVSDNLIEKKAVDSEKIDLMLVLQKWRRLTTFLISSDRFSINYVEDLRINEEEWADFSGHIEEFCEGGRHHPLADTRTKSQKSIIHQWLEGERSNFYTLEMPTGYGKTITALKLASEMARESQLSKIIYVAPYLSILGQNANNIGEALQYMPLQHHSLAVFGEVKKDEEKGVQKNKISDLHMQSWADKVICTSFVQWMRAIFPRTAQDTLRRAYLHDAVIIIDEPQIIDAGVWNLFLIGLESMCKLYRCKIIFSSATMPPFHFGLSETPRRLQVTSDEIERYRIHLVNDMDADGCAEHLGSITEPSAIAIMNTIQDAMDVYGKLEVGENTEKILLHGMMAPIHKAIQIEKIKKALENEQPIRVVSTQIIEAGVDVSFHYMYRALPIIPSMAQAAGRVNRHNEKDIGIIETGKFLRDGKDTRYIYHHSLCTISDQLLFAKDAWGEAEMTDLVNQFYIDMFDENSYQSILQDIESAYNGGWEQLSKHEVFNNQNDNRLPIFVQYQWEEDWISNMHKQLLDEFEVEDAGEIYALFIDKSSGNTWSFEKRRRFNVLFNQFVVSVPVNKALKIVAKDDFMKYRIPLLEDDERYDADRGLVLDMETVEGAFI